MSYSQKFFSIFLSIGILTIGAGCSSQTNTVLLSSSAQAQQTQETKMYTQNRYGFTFSYPANTTVIEQGSNGNQVSYNADGVLYGFPTPLLNSFSVKIGSGSEGGNEVVNIRVPNSIHFPVMKDGTWNTNVCGEKVVNRVSEPKEVMIDGKKATMITSYDTASSTKNIFYCINSPVPVIAVVSPKYQELGMSIVQSLKFTTPEAPLSQLIPTPQKTSTYFPIGVFNSVPATYKVPENLPPSWILSLNTECLSEESTYTIPTVNNGTTYMPDVHNPEFKPHCPVIGTFFLSPTTSLKAEVQTIGNPTIGELYAGTVNLHFTQSGGSSSIPDLRISTDLPTNPYGSLLTMRYVDDKALYVEYISNEHGRTYYYFDGTKWQWINLYEKVKPLITAPYPVSFGMAATEKYLYVWEEGPLQMNDFMKTEVFEKRQRSQQQIFILDRSTYKVLWNGTFWTQS